MAAYVDHSKIKMMPGWHCQPTSLTACATQRESLHVYIVSAIYDVVTVYSVKVHAQKDIELHDNGAAEHAEIWLLMLL